VKVTIDGVDRSASYQPDELDEIEVALLADNGEDGLGAIPVPTTDTSEEAYAGQQCLLEVGAVTILDGFIGAVQRDRNATMGGRQVLRYTLVDENALLNGHRAVNWIRPQETDRVRMLAAISTFLGYLSLDTSMVLNTNNETIPAKTYMTEELFDELQADCGGPTAKTMFIEHRRIHWHRQTEGDSAGLSIVSSGANRTTTFSLESDPAPTRSKDPNDLVTDVLARNPASGVSYTATDSTAQARHDAGGVRHQRLIEVDGATLAQLTTRADRELATYKTERITYEGTIGPLTAAQVALIPVGSLITCTDPVWGLTSSVQRIAGVTLSYVHPNRFMARLQLGWAKRVRVRPLVNTSTSSLGAIGTPCCPPWDGTGSPSTGQEVQNEFVWTGDGTTTTGTTAYHYVPGTLRVWVAGLNAAGYITETSPATGAFALTFAPTPGQTVRVNYTVP
jgi:hypothetical protein